MTILSTAGVNGGVASTPSFTPLPQHTRISDSFSDTTPSKSYNIPSALACAASATRCVRVTSNLSTCLHYPMHKDRRPLAPAAVAKMVVRKEDNSLVDVEYVHLPPPPLPPPRTLSVCSELDSSFFLVTVDLWSADGKREMNLVLHPSSSTDRHVSTVSAKPKKPRGSIPSATSPRSDHPSPPSSHSTPNSAPDPHRPSLDSQVCITRSPQININLSVSQL